MLDPENGDKAVNIPKVVIVPSEGEFKFRNIEINPNLEDEGFNDGDSQVEERISSTDLIGIYYGYRAPFRCILIRVEKILKGTPIHTPHGIASVVLHELGHALFDTPSLDFIFIRPTSKRVENGIYYYVEEAMANLFAHRSLRSISFNKREMGDISCFMLRQPFPYAVGAKLALSMPSKDFEIKTYITKWYYSKLGQLNIDDWKKWLSLIQGTNFTNMDLRMQHKTLFS